jgi:hypothetical protein
VAHGHLVANTCSQFPSLWPPLQWWRTLSLSWRHICGDLCYLDARMMASRRNIQINVGSESLLDPDTNLIHRVISVRGEGRERHAKKKNLHWTQPISNLRPLAQTSRFLPLDNQLPNVLLVSIWKWNSNGT